MARHESSVNYRNLIRDLAEMYPHDVGEVVVVELVANALDAHATAISIEYDPSAKVLTVTDNGDGMTPKQFDEYHDFAAGLKTRGEGIGFAGVGAKIAFNLADRVLTETRNRSFSGASDWHFESGRRLIWEDRPPVGLRHRGTRVEVHFRPNSRIPYLSREDLVFLLRRSYLPLFDNTFLKMYGSLNLYSSDLRFSVNERTEEPFDLIEHLALDCVRQFFPQRAGKRIGYGLFGLSSQEYPWGQGLCGVLLCTHGKVIKGDLFNQFPGSFGPKLFGLVEIPEFVVFLTTAKSDFIRGHGIHRKFEGLYGPVRQEFKQWLAELGVEPSEASAGDEARRLERELKKVLDAVPELGEFFGFRTRKSVLAERQGGSVAAAEVEGAETTYPVGPGQGGDGVGVLDEGVGTGHALVETGGERAKSAEPISRRARRGPRIAFATAPEKTDLAWVEGNQIVINQAHPCYVKTRTDSFARRVVSLFAIATAVQRFLVGAEFGGDLLFIDRLMKAWAER